LYAADCTLENRLDEVREQFIAERVFSRKSGFQGGQDSIVRAEARNLRKRLEAYFETEGKHEPLVVRMPKGGYSLAFQPRLPDLAPDEPIAEIDDGNETGELLTEPLTVSSISGTAPLFGKTVRSYRNVCVAMGLLAALATALAVYWYSADSQLRHRLGATAPDFPFSALFGEGQDSLIITSDTGFLQIATLAHRRITLDEYMARSYPDIPNIQPPDLIRNWNVYEFTDGRQMAIAGLILRRNAQFAQHIELRSGHEVQLDDFKDHNVVLIGSQISKSVGSVI
jgi:hypothetical protein